MEVFYFPNSKALEKVTEKKTKNLVHLHLKTHRLKQFSKVIKLCHAWPTLLNLGNQKSKDILQHITYNNDRSRKKDADY
uniref:Uncharacterized protein n=1 Tax=Rhizophora mucronata TaxID=61149 RepID=A0A2P2NZD5_RHIMU